MNLSLEPSAHGRWLWLTVLVALLALMAGAVSGVAAELALEPCHLDGLAEQVLCGQLEVPEDRVRSGGRQITLHFAVLPALSREVAADPLFLLAGGPGQGARSYARLAGALRGVRRHRDLVLLDQRGTGASHPLDCPLPAGDPTLAATGELPAQVLDDCLAGLDADPRFYTSFIAADDLDAVRAVLGFEQINLWGGSYGTRAALVYLQRYPRRVRALVLDGVMPWAHTYPLYTSRDAQRTLDLTLEACAADAACAAAFPRPAAQLAEVLAALDRAPVWVPAPEPGGEPVELGRDAFTSALRGFLYLPDHRALLPLLIACAAAGDFGPVMALTEETRRWSVATMSLGMTLSVLCTEDVPRITPEAAAAANAGTIFGSLMTASWQRMCAHWPRGEVPADFVPEASFPTPALLLSGELDPVTPPSWAEVALRQLPAGRHLVVPGAGHNTTTIGCVPRLIARFLAAGSAAGLDASCLDAVAPPPFAVGPAGAEP